MGLIYSLMLQVPAMTHRSPPSTSPVAMAQASMSNIPPQTGVPGSRPVARAASRLTPPQRWSDLHSGGSASATRDAEQLQQLPTEGSGIRSMRLVPE